MNSVLMKPGSEVARAFLVEKDDGQYNDEAMVLAVRDVGAVSMSEGVEVFHVVFAERPNYVEKLSEQGFRQELRRRFPPRRRVQMIETRDY